MYTCALSLGPASQDAVIKCVYASPGLQWSILLQRFSNPWSASHGGVNAVITYVCGTTEVHDPGTQKFILYSWRTLNMYETYRGLVLNLRFALLLFNFLSIFSSFYKLVKNRVFWTEAEKNLNTLRLKSDHIQYARGTNLLTFFILVTLFL
jgi:hypothetical protein